MELFTIELVSDEFAHFIPDNTHISLTNFLPEQLILEGQWEYAISELSYPSIYDNVTEGTFLFFDHKKHSKSSEFYYMQLGLYPSITNFVEAMNTLIQERHNHRESCITVKGSRKTQKVENYLKIKNVVLHFLVRTWDTFSVAMVAMNLEWCWEEKGRRSQNSLTTLSAYTLTWHARI